MDHDLPDLEDHEAAPHDGPYDRRRGVLRVNNRLCDTCIGHKDDRMYLGERREQFIAGTVEADTYVVCHETGAQTDCPGAVCRWYFSRYWTWIASLRVAVRFGLIEYVDPPTEEAG